MASSSAREIAAMRRAIQERLPRFRILIIGADDEQKARITRKISGARDDPVVWDPDGNWIRDTIENGWPRLGSINNEIRYRDNPGLIFHDSRGFEGDDREELQKVHKFIEERSTRVELHEQLHAIWYFVPMGIQRSPHKAEKDFFKGKGVPVVRIFTNTHPSTAREPERRKGKILANSKQEISARNLGPSDKKYLRELLRSTKSNKITVRHEPTPTGATACAINNPALRHWFISLQWDRMDLKYKNCVERVLDNHVALSEGLHGMVEGILNTFLDTYTYNFKWLSDLERRREERSSLRIVKGGRLELSRFRVIFDLEVIPLLLSTAPKTQKSTPWLIAVATFIKALIIVGNAISLHHGMNQTRFGPELTRCIQESLKSYHAQGSPTLQEVEEAFAEYQLPRDTGHGSESESDEQYWAQVMDRTYGIVSKYRLDRDRYPDREELGDVKETVEELEDGSETDEELEDGSETDEELEDAGETDEVGPAVPATRPATQQRDGKEVTGQPSQVVQAASTERIANQQDEAEVNERVVIGHWGKLGLLLLVVTLLSIACPLCMRDLLYLQ